MYALKMLPDTIFGSPLVSNNPDEPLPLSLVCWNNCGRLIGQHELHSAHDNKTN